MQVEQDFFTDVDLKRLLHPRENSRFLIALIVAVPAACLGIWAIYASMGVVLLVVGSIVLSVWIIHQLLEAILIGGSVRVSQDNFPEIYDVLLEVKKRLKYNKKIDIYIVEDGSVNAFLFSCFQTRFIVLNSAVVAGMPMEKCRNEWIWVIGRFVGALRVKHLRFDLLAAVVSGIEQLKVFNLLILPYQRAVQYSGDQIGVALCGDLNASFSAFNKLLVGKDIAGQVQFKGLVQQASQLKMSFFGWISKALSSHPHMTSRYLNLVAFARCHYPEKYGDFIGGFDSATAAYIGQFLPSTHPANPPQ
jgi:Zn-dependent protease with chaperone function